ncbi:hypothetical protein [Malikia sp.]|uniref:hypothetical protein n=1 Tax=Malikia sp. TaxID=2070706 RepID=UPI0026140599|nr:hypothetical protein [Malikia sp.]MDD2730196.1 hypothetical protein [Malikia sp.]
MFYSILWPGVLPTIWPTYADRFACRPVRLTLKFFLAFLWLLWASLAGAAQDTIHQGPALDVRVQRGDARLPLALVNRLRSGDKLLVRPDVDTLAQGDWVLLLARVSPTGNQVESRHFDVRELDGYAELEIAADNQIPVILLAPQLRSLFGLYTSLSSSASLLDAVLRADPQRFYELQKVDQINQAIQAISRGLARSVSGRKPEDAIQAAKELAAKFGVNQLDPECFKNQAVNTECVASHIVANRDFSLPSANDLTAMVGNKSSVDLNSLLVANLRLISQASEYLGSKYRDSYDFAPTFGRRLQQTQRIELFSVTRFRSGGVKTAYIYVPSWFAGATPGLSVDERRAGCYSSAGLEVQLKGRLPLASYWHDWRMTLLDPETLQPLGETTAVTLDQEAGRFSFDLLESAGEMQPRGQQVAVSLAGRFGFDPVTLGPVRMTLPWQDAQSIIADLEGLSGLIAGERATLRLRSSIASACVSEMALALPNGMSLRSEPDSPTLLDADLSQIKPSSLELTIAQAAAQPLLVQLRVLPPKARITRVEHSEWEDGITVSGERLDRIARIEVGTAVCAVDAPPESLRSQQQVRLACQGDMRHNARLPDQVIVRHRDNEPAAIRLPLSKTAARPRMSIAKDMPNALLVTPSAKAMQWHLAPDERFVSDDSGLNLLLQADPPYRLDKGNYWLQLRFRDDPRSEAQPISAPLIADFVHHELRTLGPVGFGPAGLPGVVNPIEYRVQHQPSGQAGDWKSLDRSVLLLPDLQSMSCSPTGDAWWVKGKHLDLIDGVRVPETGVSEASPHEAFSPASLVPCPDGLCLSLPRELPQGRVQLRVRWVDRVFTVRLPEPAQACAA